MKAMKAKGKKKVIKAMKPPTMKQMKAKLAKLARKTAPWVRKVFAAKQVKSQLVNMSYKCPSGHILACFKTPSDDYKCSICSGDMEQGNIVHNCQACSWNVCAVCNNAALNAEGPEAAAAVMEKRKKIEERAAVVAARDKAKADKVAANIAAKEKKRKMAEAKATMIVRKTVAKLAAKERAEATKAVCGERPTPPRAGAWGVFLEEHRDEIKQALPPDHKITAIPKAASEKFKALTDEERQVYQAKYEEKKATYEAEIEEYKRKAVANGFALEIAKPSQRQQSLGDSPMRKRRRQSLDESPVKEKKTLMRVPAEYVAPLDPDVLKEAEGLGYKAALQSLACRSDIVEMKLPADRLMRALRAAAGNVKRAAEALGGVAEQGKRSAPPRRSTGGLFTARRKDPFSAWRAVQAQMSIHTAVGRS